MFVIAAGTVHPSWGLPGEAPVTLLIDIGRFLPPTCVLCCCVRLDCMGMQGLGWPARLDTMCGRISQLTDN